MSETNELTRTNRDEMERLRDGRRIRPAVDIFDSTDNILLTADLPGVASNDLSVSFDANELTIEGHRALPLQRGDEEVETLIYTRSFRLPQGIDTDKIVANLKHGVLSVTLPRAEELKPRQIAVAPG